MTNAEYFIREIAHDIFCAASESGSDVFQSLPKDMEKSFHCEFNKSYDDKELLSLVEWLKSECSD